MHVTLCSILRCILQHFVYLYFQAHLSFLGLQLLHLHLGQNQGHPGQSQGHLQGLGQGQKVQDPDQGQNLDQDLGQNPDQDLGQDQVLDLGQDLLGPEGQVPDLGQVLQDQGQGQR